MCIPMGPTEKQGGGFPVKGAACPRGWTVEVLRISTLDMAPKVSVRVADLQVPLSQTGVGCSGVLPLWLSELEGFGAGSGLGIGSC